MADRIDRQDKATEIADIQDLVDRSIIAIDRKLIVISIAVSCPCCKLVNDTKRLCMLKTALELSPRVMVHPVSFLFFLFFFNIPRVATEFSPRSPFVRAEFSECDSCNVAGCVYRRRKLKFTERPELYHFSHNFRTNALCNYPSPPARQLF